MLDDINSIKQSIKLSDEEKEEAVQKLLDRLIFIRSCEDRKIENEQLRAARRTWEEKGEIYSLYPEVAKIFEQYYLYDSNLFKKGHVCEKINLFNGTIRNIIDGLYYNNSERIPYDFKKIPADILGGIYEQYLGHILKKANSLKG